MAKVGIEALVGSVGDSYDNALAETINALYKTEVIHRQSWKSRETIELETLKWVNWFNHRRLLEPIGNIPPAEAERNYYQQLIASAMAAGLTIIGLREIRGGSSIRLIVNRLDIRITDNK